MYVQFNNDIAAFAAYRDSRLWHHNRTKLAFVSRIHSPVASLSPYHISLSFKSFAIIFFHCWFDAFPYILRLRSSFNRIFECISIFFGIFHMYCVTYRICASQYRQTRLADTLQVATVCRRTRWCCAQNIRDRDHRESFTFYEHSVEILWKKTHEIPGYSNHSVKCARMFVQIIEICVLEQWKRDNAIMFAFTAETQREPTFGQLAGIAVRSGLCISWFMILITAMRPPLWHPIESDKNLQLQNYIHRLIGAARH